jgi:tetratricopeptide (TPR) repeat protein
LEEMAALAREAGDDVRLSDALNGLANLYQNTGIDDPRAPLEEALAVKRRLGDKRGEADSLNLLTTVYISLGQIAEGLAASAEAHDLYEALNDTDGLARNEWSLGLTLYEVIGDYARAIEHLDRSLTLSRQVNNRALECGNMMVIGSANVRLGDYPAGRGYLEPAIEMAKQIGDRPAEGWALLYLSWHDRELKEFETSHARVQIASDIGKEIGSDNLLWYVLLSLTRLHLAWSRPHTALPFAQQTYEFSQRLSVWGETRPRSGALLARTYRQIGRLDEARRYALEALREMEAFHEEAVTEPHGVYMDCYRALSASGAPEAPIALQQAYTALMHLADKITDPERRARFLTDVTMSREIVAEWEAFNQ